MAASTTITLAADGTPAPIAFPDGLPMGGDLFISTDVDILIGGPRSQDFPLGLADELRLNIAPTTPLWGRVATEGAPATVTLFQTLGGERKAITLDREGFDEPLFPRSRVIHVPDDGSAVALTGLPDGRALGELLVDGDPVFIGGANRQDYPLFKPHLPVRLPDLAAGPHLCPHDDPRRPPQPGDLAPAGRLQRALRRGRRHVVANVRGRTSRRARCELVGNATGPGRRRRIADGRKSTGGPRASDDHATDEPGA